MKIEPVSTASLSPDIQIKQQPRQSLALKLTPRGLLVLIPRHLKPDSEQVQRFIAQGLARLTLPSPPPASEHLDKEALLAMVEDWAGRLGVTVRRVQFQPMRNKWGSISTAGNLTLAGDLTRLPRRLVEYVVCHELLHLQVANHGKVYYLLLGSHIPDWREREQELARWALLVG